MKLRIKKVGFDIVGGCQLRCVGCPNSILKPKIKSISIGVFEKCLDNIDADIDLFRLFNFGEALLHPKIIDILMILKKRSLNIKGVEISTNGQYFDDDVIKYIFKNDLINNLVVSCDGNGTKEEYEARRPPAKWDTLMFFMKSVFNYKKQYSSKIKLMARIICQGKKSENAWNEILNPMDFRPLFRDWFFLPNTNNKFLKKEFSLPNRLCSIFGGFISGNQLYVNCNGIVIPCCSHPEAFILGDLSKNKYTDIVAGEKTTKMKEAIEKHRKDIPICKDCGM